MKLSNQAVGALLVTLQKCISEETDITELLRDWELELRGEDLYVTNVKEVSSAPEIIVPE